MNCMNQKDYFAHLNFSCIAKTCFTNFIKNRHLDNLRLWAEPSAAQRPFRLLVKTLFENFHDDEFFVFFVKRFFQLSIFGIMSTSLYYFTHLHDSMPLNKVDLNESWFEWKLIWMKVDLNESWFEWKLI